MIVVTFNIPDQPTQQDATFEGPENENHGRVLRYVEQSYLREIASTWVIEHIED